MRKYLPLFLLAFSLPALAHPGHGADSFHAGFFHPLTGLDHLLMLTGAGVLSALSGQVDTALCHPRHDACRRHCGQSAWWL